jgi:hypothetical protein
VNDERSILHEMSRYLNVILKYIVKCGVFYEMCMRRSKR